MMIFGEQGHNYDNTKCTKTSHWESEILERSFIVQIGNNMEIEPLIDTIV